MSFRNASNIHKNVRRNAREQRLEFMNSQAALIAQKKLQIEQKLAQAEAASAKKTSDDAADAQVVQPPSAPAKYFFLISWVD